MIKNMKKIHVIILLIIILGGASFVLNRGAEGLQDGITEEPKIEESLVSEFKYGVIDRAVALGGVPIEGFDAYLLMNAFPGLIIKDFEAVTSLEGVYSVDSGELTYSRTQDGPVTSAEMTVSSDGYTTLLANLSLRFEVSPLDLENITVIIDRIEAAPNAIGIQNIYPEKVVYTDNMSVGVVPLIAHCEALGGIFSECGSDCPATAEMCTQQCAYTCELDSIAGVNE